MTEEQLIQAIGAFLDTLSATPVESPDPFPNEMMFELNGKTWAVSVNELVDSPPAAEQQLFIANAINYTGDMREEAVKFFDRVGEEVIKPMMSDRDTSHVLNERTELLILLHNTLATSIKMMGYAVANRCRADGADDSFYATVIGEGLSQGIGAVVAQVWPKPDHPAILAMLLQSATMVAKSERELHDAMSNKKGLN